MIVFAAAWRNLWRNRRRTAITLGAVTSSTVAVIVFAGLLRGMIASMVGNITNLSVGEVQIHAPGYVEDREIYASIEGAPGILAAAAARGIPAAARSYGYGLVAHGTKSAGARFEGVDPAREREVFDLARHVDPGGAFLAETAGHGMVLGRKLARSLGVTVGSEIVVVVQASDGSLGNDLFTVTGILQSIGGEIDRGAAIVHRDDFETLFVSGGRVHEIAANTRGRVPLEDLRRQLAALAPGEEVRTWRQLKPIWADLVTIMGSITWVISAILFLAAGLGVMNTMLMAANERVREFGVLKALGASSSRIARDVAAEAGMLAAVAMLVGGTLGAAATSALAVHGIDTAAFAGEFSIGGLAFDPVWRPVLHPSDLVAPLLWLWVATLAAALYPAALAARLEPVEALRRV